MAIAWYAHGADVTVGTSFLPKRVDDLTCPHCWFVTAAAVIEDDPMWEEAIDMDCVPGAIMLLGIKDGTPWRLLIDQLQFIH